MSNTLALSTGGLWAYLLLLVAVFIAVWLVLLLKFVNARPGRCVACGYSLAGLARKRCPECGAEQDKDEFRADFARVQRFIFRCSLLTLGMIGLGFMYTIVEPRLPILGEVVFSGRFAPSTSTFAVTGEGMIRGPVRPGDAMPRVERMELVSGADRVSLLRDPSDAGWVYADTLGAASGADIEAKLNQGVSAQTLDQLLAHNWDQTWPFVWPEIVGSTPPMTHRDFAMIDSKNLYNRSQPLVNKAAAAVFTLAAVIAVWWVCRSEKRRAIGS